MRLNQQTIKLFSFKTTGSLIIFYPRFRSFEPETPHAPFGATGFENFGIIIELVILRLCQKKIQASLKACLIYEFLIKLLFTISQLFLTVIK